LTVATVLFHVESLLGSGHSRRIDLLARACTKNGLHAVVATGSPWENADGPLPYTLCQLPAALVSDGNFSHMLDAYGHLVDAVWWQQRATLLQDCVNELRPTIVIVEGFPFARRRFRQEILQLIKQVRALRPEALIISSIRDILQPRSPEREEATQVWFQHFDRVLVHGDPEFIPLSASCGFAEKIAPACFYTGWVTPKVTSESDTDQGCGEVIVSAGGGAAGTELLSVIAQAKELSEHLREATWRVLVGHRGQTIPAIPGIIVEPNRTDFPVLLSNCRVSISQAGYNTVADLVAANCRAVLVPFEGGGEREQWLRAMRLDDLGRAVIIRESALTAANLAAAVDRAAKLPWPPPMMVNRAGASKTATLLQSWLVGH